MTKQKQKKTKKNPTEKYSKRRYERTEVEAWFDGSCEPRNPGGTARTGIVVKRDGAIAHAARGTIGTGPLMSNNVAEYAAANAVMEYLIENKVTGDVTIFGDSLLVIRALRKRKPSKGLCGPYAQTSVELTKQLLCTPDFVWIAREQNAEADKLSRTESDSVYELGEVER